MAPEDDSEVPESGAVFTFGKSKFAENVPNKFWVRNDKVFITACGDEHTALVAESGRIFTFGSNDWGQLGLGHTKSATKPSCVKSLKHEKVKLAACGRTHTIVATESGLLYAFGANGENQLGVDDTPGSNNPKCIDTLEVTEYQMLAAGADHSMALTDAGQVLVWGSGSEGQLGLGAETECPKPKALPFDKHVTCIACGYYHSALVTDDGELYTFGESEGGKLGLGEDPDEYDTPQRVTAISERVKWVSCGGSHTVAVTEKGQVYTFGNGANGQLGHGTMVLELSLPQRLTSPDSRVIFSSCGENHTALVTEKGHLYSFGDGRHGKLGLGMESFANQFKPCKLKRFDKLFVEKVSCGGCHMLALAHPRLQNGHGPSDDEGEEESPRINSLKADSLDLNGSISARDRRRQISPMPSFNRTLPTLASMKSLPPLNSTLPALGNGQDANHPLSKSLLPNIDIAKEKGLKRQQHTEQLESDSDEDYPVRDTVQKVTTADVHSAPRSQPKPVPRRRLDQKRGSGDSRAQLESREDGNTSDKDTVEAPVPSPRSDKSGRGSEEGGGKQGRTPEEESEEELSEEEEGRKQAKEKKSEKEEKKKKDKKKKKTGGIFGRKKIESEDEDEEEEDEEIEEEEKVEEKHLKKEKGKQKDKDKTKDKKNKGKESENEEEEDEDDKDEDGDKVSGKKKKDKKKDKGKEKKKGKKKKKDEEEEEEEDEEDEDEGKDGKKKDKEKKDKKSKDKKEKDKKKVKGGKDQEDEEEEREEGEDKGEETEDHKDTKQEEEEKKPAKKSRTCTIL